MALTHQGRGEGDLRSFDDPVDGYPKSYPRDGLPKIDHYPGGQTLPTPKSIDFKPGALLDHVDLQAAIDHKVTVAEATYSNSISVSEHVVMMILGLVRNYIPSYEWVVKGGWNIADCVTRSYDVEGMHVGNRCGRRIGLSVSARTY